LFGESSAELDDAEEDNDDAEEGDEDGGGWSLKAEGDHTIEAFGSLHHQLT